MVSIRKAGALILSNKRLLIVKPREKPHFINPGGKYEEGESAAECLKRELQEEINVKIESLKHYKTYKIEKAAHSNYPLILELYIVTIKGEPGPSAEIEKIAWLDRKSFERKKFNVAPSFYKYVPDLIRDKLL